MDGKSGIFSVPAEGGGKVQLLFGTEQLALPTSLTPDGRTLLYTQNDRIHLRPVDVPSEAARSRPLHETVTAREAGAELSPDGRWVAYLSLESGTWEAYLHSFQGAGRRERISTNGAQYVRWFALPCDDLPHQLRKPDDVRDGYRLVRGTAPASTHDHDRRMALTDPPTSSASSTVSGPVAISS